MRFSVQTQTNPFTNGEHHFLPLNEINEESIETMRASPHNILRGFLAFGLLAVAMLTASAQQASRLLDLQQLTNKEFVLKFTATAGQRYRIDGATNAEQWDPLTTLVTTATNQYTDSATPYLPSRAYRVLALANTNALTGDHLPTAEGDIVIHPINHATFVLSWNGKTLYNDPVSGSGRFTGLPPADLILISHDHSDHFDASALTAVKGTNTVIIAPRAVYNSMSAALKAITIVLTNGASTNLPSFSIAAIPAYNLSTSYHTKGVGNGYVVTISGKRFYMSGDTEDIPEMRALKDIDVAFVCVNLPFTMTVARAVSAVREFKPKVFYPYHFQGTPSTDLNALKKQIGTDVGVEVRLRKWY